ncbi:MAG TPA: hypothetical protein VKQ30_20875 [Ktedonobacterales bacterium]|nr:hypothetical protein [Ktedonobacterales bacterium]
MALFDTVADYLTEARNMLQDYTQPYRYADATIITALNEAVYEARRVRADLFLPNPSSIPSLAASGDSTSFIDVQYRLAFLDYVVGHCEAFDAEPNQDSRAQAFIQGFLMRLTSPISPISVMGANQ